MEAAAAAALSAKFGVDGVERAKQDMLLQQASMQRRASGYLDLRCAKNQVQASRTTPTTYNELIIIIIMRLIK